MFIGVCVSACVSVVGGLWGGIEEQVKTRDETDEPRAIRPYS